MSNFWIILKSFNMFNKQLTKNFNLCEFHCRDGRLVPLIYEDNVQALARELQVIRDAVGAPLHINSCYRPPDYNLRVGGVKNSRHLTASAADITTKAKTPKQLHSLIEALISKGSVRQGGLGLYPGFVHYDIRGRKARW